jgi:hypothetical protein
MRWAVFLFALLVALQGDQAVPQLFGWMIHVYPFEETPQKIWTH